MKSRKRQHQPYGILQYISSSAALQCCTVPCGRGALEFTIYTT